MKNDMTQIRCHCKNKNGYTCNRRLFDIQFTGTGVIKILCPKCKQFNTIQLKSSKDVEWLTETTAKP